MKYIPVLVTTLLFTLTASVANAADGHLPWGNFLLRIINFAIFIGIIWYVSGKAIKAFFKSYREDAVTALEEAKQMKLDATKQLAEAEERLRSIEEECNKLIEEGKKQAEALSASIIDEANKQAERLLSQAKQAAQMEGVQERALLQAKLADDIVANLEEQLVKRLNKKGSKEHLALIDKSLSKVVLS